MENYLTKTLEKLRTNTFGNLSIVLGNESCDLDSAVSAIVYASFLYWQHMQIKCKVCTRSKRDEATYRDDIFIPILNVARQDFPLKTEVDFCLKEHGIDANKLVFRDDFDWRELTSKCNTSVTLVDHHVLAKKDRFLTSMVTEIIDHRPVDKNDWKYKDDTRSSIEVVGSCCSLVARRARELGKLFAKEDDFFNAFPTATDLLHSGIILDTVNFSKEVNKGTPVDEEMVLFLESILKPSSPEENRSSKLSRLVRARRAVSALSAAQLLRKDVKVAGHVLVPSFPVPVEEFLRLPGALPAVYAALQERECSIAVLLGMSLTDGLRRDAAVCSHEEAAKAAQLAKHLQQWKNPPLQLSPKDLPYAQEAIYFTQLNLSASRKQYMPAIANFLDKAAKP